MKNTLLALMLLAGIASASTTTVNLSGTGRFKAFDPDTGALLAGGKLQSYVCGTTTPTSTYADSTGTVANANPVILDGSGESPVWLDPAVCYKLVLKDSLDAVIWTLDNVNTPAAGVFTTLTVTGAVTFSSTVSATQFTSTIATGTAPLVVTSTTKVTNLNADKLDGGDWDNPAAAIGAGTRVPSTSQFTNLDISGNEVLGGALSMASGSKITNYNGIATVSNGVPSEIATADFTAQNANIGTNTLYAVPANGAGQYRLTWNAKVTTAAGTSSTLGALTITYTDPDGVAVTVTAAAALQTGAMNTANAGNTTQAALYGTPLLLNCKASTNIVYFFSYTSNAASAMQYNLHLKLEAQ